MPGDVKDPLPKKLLQNTIQYNFETCLQNQNENVICIITVSSFLKMHDGSINFGINLFILISC